MWFLNQNPRTMKNCAIVMLGIAFLLSCTPAEVPIDKEAETKAAMKVMNQFYEAFARADAEGLQMYICDDLMMFDMGHHMKVEDAMAMMQNNLDMGMQDLSFTLELMASDVTADLLVLYYTNHAKGIMGETEINMNFLENAVLRQTEEGWKVRFFHSTEVVTEEAVEVPTE